MIYITMISSMNINKFYFKCKKTSVSNVFVCCLNENSNWITIRIYYVSDQKMEQETSFTFVDMEAFKPDNECNQNIMVSKRFIILLS